MCADAHLRVLLVAPDTTGGIGHHVRMLADGLLRRGHDVTVCAPQSTLQRLQFSAAQGGRSVEAVALPIGSGSALLQRRRLAHMAREHDVTHAHGVRAGALAALASMTPLVVTWHNAPLGSRAHRAVHQLLEGICARRAELVLGASEDLVARARAVGAKDARLLAVVAPERKATVPTVRGELHQPPTVLAVARLHRQKRLDLLVQVAARWPAGPDRPQFVIAGDGPLLAALRRQAERQAAPVTFLGARTDIADLLRTADVVALPSDWEARPLVAQEALAAGVPLVATDVGGVRDLVGDAAVLVRPGSVQALEAGLREVLADTRLRSELQRMGPEQAARWPTAEDMIEQLIAFYLSVRRG